jgi:hypothetical protein
VGHKRLAATRWGEIARITLHEKKKKISLVQKPGAGPDTALPQPFLLLFAAACDKVHVFT